MLTTKEAAARLGVSTTAIRHYYRYGRLPGAEYIRDGRVRRLMIPEEAINNFERKLRGRPVKMFTYLDYLILRRFDKDQVVHPGSIEPGDTVKNAQKHLFAVFEAQASKPERVPQDWWNSEKARWESESTDRKWWNGIQRDLNLES